MTPAVLHDISAASCMSDDDELQRAVIWHPSVLVSRLEHGRVRGGCSFASFLDEMGWMRWNGME